MEVVISEDCGSCGNFPRIEAYVMGCRALLKKVQDNEDIEVVHDGLVRCPGYPNSRGQSMSRKICRAQIIAPGLRPVTENVVMTDAGIMAKTVVEVTPPPVLDTRVTVSSKPLQLPEMPEV